MARPRQARPAGPPALRPPGEPPGTELPRSNTERPAEKIHGKGGRMARHPTVVVPDIGPMDHAWDLLGEWQAEFEVPEMETPVRGKVMFRSWTDAELQLDPIEAAIAGIPSSVPLERASEIHLTDAGGGALQWVLHAPSTNWSLQATLWPGSLHLFVHDADDDEEQLYRARATRDREYYRRKYPLETK